MADFLVVCDVDSTLINEEVIDLIGDAVGVSEEISHITARAMNGEIDFTESLTARVALLAGLSVDLVAEAARAVTLTQGAEQLVEAVHTAGGRIIAVSGGFHEVLDPLASSLGLDAWTANRFEASDGHLTGLLDGAIVDAAAKARILVDYAAEHYIPLSRTIAVGDGANDLDMMAVAGLSVAFCAKPLVAERADVSLLHRNLAVVAGLFGASG